jgi:anaerobic nitric oxide reductase flavorubredoxin
MQPVKLATDIYWIGVNDHATELFEGLWPIKETGVSYNSYLINDEKKAIIDVSKAITGADFLEQAAGMIDLASLDYIIINHMEPDHSGALQALRRAAPGAQLVGSEKTRKMLESFYGISDNVLVVKDGDTLALGQHTLRFISTPNVHWPETIMTYETLTQTLFCCDAFGSFGALDGRLFVDQLDNYDAYINEMQRYFVNIIATFSRPVETALGKLADVPIKLLAPSHGVLWRQPKDIQRAIDLYRQWVGVGTSGRGQSGITMVYGSMYGNTEKMTDLVAQGIASEGVPLSVFDVSKVDASYILPPLFLQQGVIISAPTYEGLLFPTMSALLEMVATKRIRHKTAGFFGNYGWSGGAKKCVERITERLKWDLVDTFEFIGSPSLQDIETGLAFGASFARRIKEQAA